MNFYPIFIDIKNKKCIVVGGGKVAYRKIKTLCRHGAVIEVVSPNVIQEIEDLISKNIIGVKRREYEKDDLQDAWMVFAATDRRDVNAAVAADAEKLNLLVNCSDNSGRSSFISPAVFQEGDLAIAVSTGGDFPKFAQKIRKELEKQYSNNYSTVLKSLEKIRQRVMLQIHDEQVRKKILDRVIDDNIIGIAFNQGITAFEKEINNIFEEYSNEKKDSTGLQGK